MAEDINEEVVAPLVTEINQALEQSEDKYIYFIEAVGANRVKIGISYNPEKRFASLRNSVWTELKLLGCLPGSVAKEKEIHKRWTEYHVRGEWFKITQQMRDWIKANTYPQFPAQSEITQPDKVYNKLAEIALEQYGYVTTADVRDELGLPANYLTDKAARNVIEHVAHGIYRLPNMPVTGLEQYYEATLWPQQKGILSHETALDLYGLCDVNPNKVHVTVPAAYRTHREVPGWMKLHNRNLATEDCTLYEGIPIVTARKAIMDCLEIPLRADLLEQAIINANREGYLSKSELKDVHRIQQKVFSGMR